MASSTEVSVLSRRKPLMHKLEHSLDEVAIGEQHRKALKQLGYVSLEQFVSAAQVAGPILSKYLNEDVGKIISAMPAQASPIPEEARPIIESAQYTLGVPMDLEPATPAGAPLPVAIAFVPPGPVGQDEVNLIKELPPIRDQGKRGTCVAHAAVAIFEHYLRPQQASRDLYINDLSEQFLYWNCKQNDGYPNANGTWLQVAVPLLARDGCCLETMWGYNPVPIAGNEGQGPATPQALAEALQFRVPGFHQLDPKSVAAIKTEIARGRSVAFSIPVFNSWLNSMQIRLTGDITLPIPGEVPAGGHAMSIVGYHDLPEEDGLGKGRFLIRNSWDHYWAVQSVHGTGYGTIPYQYLATLGREAYSIQ